VEMEVIPDGKRVSSSQGSSPRGKRGGGGVKNSKISAIELQQIPKKKGKEMKRLMGFRQKEGRGGGASKGN